MAVAIKIRHTHRLPTGRNSRPKRGANENVAVQIPYDGLARARIVEDIIWMTVVVKVIRYRRGWRIC